MNNRISYIDIFKGFGIFFVVFGHVTHIGVLREYIWDFHMPLFFFVSGLLYKSNLTFIDFPVLSKGFEIETEMTIHALDKNFLLQEVPVSYRDRPAGSVSKLNTYSDGLKVIMTIFKLFRDYKPLFFFSIISVILLVIAAGLFIPVFIEYLQTGLVPRYPTLIVSGFIVLLAMFLWTCGLILEVLVKKHRQLYEILLNK